MKNSPLYREGRKILFQNKWSCIGEESPYSSKIPALGRIAEEIWYNALKWKSPFGKCCFTGCKMYFTKQNVENTWLFEWENSEEIQSWNVRSHLDILFLFHFNSPPLLFLNFQCWYSCSISVLFYFFNMHACMCVLCDNLVPVLTVFTNWNIFDFSCSIYCLHFSSQIWLKTGSGVLTMPWSKWTPFLEGLWCQLIIWLGRTSPTSIFLLSFSAENSYLLVSEFSFFIATFPW